VPGTEAHGGYAFCGVAALRLLGELSSFDLQALKVRAGQTYPFASFIPVSLPRLNRVTFLAALT
jgi:hypothetical protein